MLMEPASAMIGDARQLRRVFQNLVANALKFRGDAHAHVAVVGREGSRDWVITVADRGPGVRPEDRNRIFAMFARADRARSGSGIGPAVCRRVVEARGGRIWVEPAEGGGSAFRFTLPREDRSAA
jgi:signal transduction histidine kinase